MYLSSIRVEGDEVDGVLGDLSRARSFRTEAASGQKVFRASDLLQVSVIYLFYGCKSSNSLIRIHIDVFRYSVK